MKEILDGVLEKDTGTMIDTHVLFETEIKEIP